MLAFQSMKRARDDDEDEDEERYIAKSRPWAFPGFRHAHTNYPSPANLTIRASPPRNVPNLDVVTPTLSDYSDANSPASIHDDIPPSSPPNQFDADMDMDDEDLDNIASPPLESSFVAFMRPAKLNANLFGQETCVNSTARVPTPIYPNFHSGGVGGLGYPSSGMAGGISMSNGFLGVPSNPVLQHARKLAHVDDERGHRMPSPISEDDDIPDTPTALTQSQLERLSVASEHMELEETTRDGENDLLAPPGVLTTPRGRKRSGAFTGKGRFSMGYRDDCEKCRQRVPGHYSHILT